MNSSLTFRHEFDRISELSNDDKYSKIHFCANLPWSITFRADTKEDSKELQLFLGCNREDKSEIWSCDHQSSIKLINRVDGGRSIIIQVCNSYNAKQPGWGRASVIDFEDLLNPEQGFVENDSIIVEATINVKKVSGIQKSLQFDFSTPGFGSDNIALIIEGKKVYADKKYLALHSDVFKSMFFGNYTEQDKDEIELPDVSYEEFIEFLYVIYPSYRIITVDSYEFILAMADRFFVKYACNAVESYLMKTSAVKLMDKLIVADRFRLEALTKHCVSGYKTLQEIKASESQFATKSDATKATLWHRTMELIM